MGHKRERTRNGIHGRQLGYKLDPCTLLDLTEFTADVASCCDIRTFHKSAHNPTNRTAEGAYS